MNHKVVLLLGSNLGNKVKQLQDAVKLLAENAGQLQKSSGLYETAPWGLAEQPTFINQVIILESALSPGRLMEVIHEIEGKLGRLRKVKWGSRTIDIDILYYDNEVIHGSRLIIPHPELHNRRFTLVPLCEIDPDYIHPVLRFSNKQLLEQCLDPLQVEAVLNTK